jgi:hypothetical protein
MKPNQILDLEHVEEFLEDDEPAFIMDCNSITDEAAAALSRYNGDLPLFSIETLSITQARSLSNNDGLLILDGLTSISDELAEILSKHRGMLSLQGLTSLTERTAEHLSCYQGKALALTRIESFSVDAVKTMCCFKGIMFLNPKTEELLVKLRKTCGFDFLILSEFITSMLVEGYLESNYSFSRLLYPCITVNADKFLKEEGIDNDFSNLISISDEDAEALSKHLSSELDLTGLEYISDLTAEHLSKHKYNVYLGGLLSISEVAAKHLASTDWDSLKLYSLTSIDKKSAKALCMFKRHLHINPSVSLTSDTVEAVGTYEQFDFFEGLKSLSREAAEVLSHRKKPLSLLGLTELSDGAAEALARNGTYITDLDLSGLESLFDLSAHYLSQYKGNISLLGLKELSDDAAEAFANHHGGIRLNASIVLSDKGLTALNRKSGKLIYDGNHLKELSDEKAELFSRYNGELILGSVTRMSDKVAQALSKHKGRISLCRLKTISDAAAEALSHNEGDLCLKRIKVLSIPAAESLSRHKGRLYLNGVTSLHDNAAEFLSKHEGKLVFRNLKSISRKSLLMLQDVLYFVESQYPYSNDDDHNCNERWNDPNW